MKNETEITKSALSAAAAFIGRKGGQVCGPSKARNVTSEMARHAVNTRWARYHEAKNKAEAEAG